MPERIPSRRPVLLQKTIQYVEPGLFGSSDAVGTDPTLLKSYNLPLDQLIVGFNASNSLIAAGALEGSTGRFAVKVPSLIERPQDVLKIPMASGHSPEVSIAQ